MFQAGLHSFSQGVSSVWQRSVQVGQKLNLSKFNPLSQNFSTIQQRSICNNGFVTKGGMMSPMYHQSRMMSCIGSYSPTNKLAPTLFSGTTMRDNGLQKNPFSTQSKEKEVIPVLQRTKLNVTNNEDTKSGVKETQKISSDLTQGTGRLAGKVILITGIRDKNSIAYATAKRCIEEGATVILSYHRQIHSVNKIAKELGAGVVPLNMENDESIEQAFETVRNKFGKVDSVLFSPAFYTPYRLGGDSINCERSDINQSNNIGGDPAFKMMMKLGLPHMNEGCNVTALTYLGGERAMLHYNLGGVKAGLEQSTRQVSNDKSVTDKNIRVNTLSPGPMVTTASSGVGGFKEFHEYSEEISPLGNATAIDVAHYFVFLSSSNESGKITGQNLRIDGGFSSIIPGPIVTSGVGEVLFDGQSFTLTRIEDGNVELHFNQRRVQNVINYEAYNELLQVMSILTTDPNINGLLITNLGPMFGADLKEFENNFKHPEQLKSWIMSNHNEVFNVIEDLPFPVVIAVNHAALGGGMELSLACHCIVTHPEAKFALPEYQFQLLPGFGATERVTRKTGDPDLALQWLVKGDKPYTAQEAKDCGVVDVIAPSQKELRDTAILELNKLKEQQEISLDDIEVNQDNLQLTKWEPDPKILNSKSMKTTAGQEALKLVKSHVDNGVLIGKEGRELRMEEEANTFVKLSQKPEPIRMLRSFFDIRDMKNEAREATLGAVPVNQMVILGGGSMAKGINKVSQGNKHVGPDHVSMLKRKEIEQESFDGLSDCDLVIETISENYKDKVKLLSSVAPHMNFKEGALLATNTSTFSPTLLAEDVAKNLEKDQREAFLGNFVGLHYFNPPEKMPLVEVIVTKYTTKEAKATAIQHILDQGKIPFVVTDNPETRGFCINRILMAYLFSAMKLLFTGTDIATIEKAMKSYGFPMGTAELIDLVGVDVCLSVAKSMMAFDSKMEVTGQPIVELLESMVKQGNLGMKSGKGFYKYSLNEQGKPVKGELNDEVQELITKSMMEEIRHEDEISYQSRTIEEVQQDVMTTLILTAAETWMDGLVDSPKKIDTALKLSVGYPPHQPSPLTGLDEASVSKKEFIDKSKELYQKSNNPLHDPKRFENHLINSSVLSN